MVNNKPRSANWSIFGVTAWGWPPRAPTQSFKSSTAMNRMLRGDLGSAPWVLLGDAADVRDSKSTKRAVRSVGLGCGTLDFRAVRLCFDTLQLTTGFIGAWNLG